jgi:starch phosphorylase
MKRSLNGALTIGTLDGANVEILERVGAENFFLFGLKVDEVQRLKTQGYRPWELPERDPELRGVLDLIGSGALSDGEEQRYAPLLRSLIDHDEYCVLADYRAYIEAQALVEEAFLEPDAWARRAIQTVARMGYFSSDRSVGEYCEKIWGIPAVKVAVPLA